MSPPARGRRSPHLGASLLCDAVSGELTVALEGALLEVKYGKCGCPPGTGTPSTGPAFALALQGANALTKGAPSNMAQTIDSVGSFQALPLPTGWEGRVVLIAPVLDTTPAFVVRLTYDDATTSTIPAQGLVLLETDRDNPITEVAIKGAVTVAWLVTGQVG